MKYMVLIAKHHDGFSQFDSKLTDYDIMATPYGRDIVKQFVDACHKHGMKRGPLLLDARLVSPRLPRRRQREVRRVVSRRRSRNC